MAEGGNRTSTASSYKGSDQVFDFTCTPCVEDGRFVEAVNFCVDCAEYFCPSCTKQHNKFGMTSGHNVVSTDQADQTNNILPTERCQDHTGERISTYCAEHDIAVCGMCLALNHRACKRASYIPKIAGGPGQKKERQRVKDEISQALDAMSQVKLSIQDRQATKYAEKEECLKHIQHFTQKLIKHDHDLEKAAVEEVDDHFRKTTNSLQYDMKCVDDVTTKMKTRLKNLNNTHVTNDSHTFFDIKHGEKEVQDANQLKKRVTSSGLGQAKTTFAVEESLDTFLNDVKYLGKITSTKPYKAVLKGQYNVRLKDDDYICNIANVCMLSDGRILMTDYVNNCIKLLDTSQKSLKMPSASLGICQTSQDEVAVTSRDRKIHFVNVAGKKWKLTRSFQVEDVCRGIAYSNDQLLISCGGFHGSKEYVSEGPGFVGIYDMSGTIHRKIQVDIHGRQIFSVPRHITTTSDGRKIHIADDDGGVITVNRKGNVLSRCAGNLKDTTGICAVSDDILIACGRYSDNVQQLDSRGNLVAELLSSKDGIYAPLSLFYVRDSSKLIVTLNESDEIWCCSDLWSLSVTIGT